MCITGESLDDEQVETLFADCMDPEDDEGFIPYSRKYSFHGRASSNVFCAYTICKRRLSIPHVTLCLRTNQKNPHHSALCTLYHQLDLKNTNKPKNMCMRVSMFACPFLQHYTRKKKTVQLPNVKRMVSARWLRLVYPPFVADPLEIEWKQSSSSAWWAILSSSTKQ